MPDTTPPDRPYGFDHSTNSRHDVFERHLPDEWSIECYRTTVDDLLVVRIARTTGEQLVIRPQNDPATPTHLAGTHTIARYDETGTRTKTVEDPMFDAQDPTLRVALDLVRSIERDRNTPLEEFYHRTHLLLEALCGEPVREDAVDARDDPVHMNVVEVAQENDLEPIPENAGAVAVEFAVLHAHSLREVVDYYEFETDDDGHAVAITRS